MAPSGVVRLRDEQERELHVVMGDKGYIPVLGMGPYISLSYDFKEDKQKFVCSAYGVFVGSEGVKKWMGVDVYDGKYRERPTPQPTLGQLSTDAELS